MTESRPSGSGEQGTDDGTQQAERSKSTAGPVAGLYSSLSQFAGTLVAIVQTRMELLTTELQEEVQRAAGLVLWTLIALFTVLIGLFFGGLTIVFVYWETHRVLAALLVTGAFLSCAVIAVLILTAKMRSQQRFLDATLTELAKDTAALRSRMS